MESLGSNAPSVEESSPLPTKRCNICGKHKPLDKFTFEHNYCRKCKAEKDILRRREVKIFIKDYLLKNPCVDCGEANPVVLEFDHVRGRKFKDIHTMIRNRYNIKAITKEIEKCEVRCSNCHKIRHDKERREKIGRFKNIRKA